MKKYRNDDFEFTVRDLAFFDIAEEQWDLGQRGVLVEEVKPGSWAELSSLYSGDLIIEVDGRPVENVDALRKSMEQIAVGKEKSATVKVLRGIHTAFLELESNWKD